MAAKQRKTELKVFFDTNALYTQVPSDLVRKEVAELVARPIEDPNLSITWHLPEVVLDERSFQMAARAIELLPSVSKLERLLGHNLAITPEVVRDRVAAAIERQCKELKLLRASVDYASVDLRAIVSAAVARTPPFEVGQKEKGFRDAIAIESFMQELDRSPKTTCRLAFVSEDALVRQAIEGRTIENKNVRVLTDLEELKGLINTLTSDVPEEYVAELIPKAAKLFWNSDGSGFYETAKIWNELITRFDFITQLPPGATQVRHKRINFSAPSFIEKKNATIYWQTVMSLEQELLSVPAQTPSATTGTGLLSMPTSPSQQPLMEFLSAIKKAPEPTVYSTRTIRAIATWSARVNSRLTLSGAKLEGLRMASQEDVTSGA